MVQKTANVLSALYADDETAWLDVMADLIRRRQLDELDLENLQEYLIDMARRDRREVASRLAILIAHILKWVHQPEQRAASWRRTIVVQRQELARLLESSTLRLHAEAILGDAYANAVEQAVADTGLDEATFPAECAWTVDQLLAPEVLGD